MTKPECLAFQRAVFEAGKPSHALREHPDLGVHLDGCVACGRWLQAFSDGVADERRAAALGTDIMARTAGATCLRARELAGEAFDAPLPAVEAALLAQHLEACDGCRAVVAEMTTVAEILPALAHVAPGPAFTARVLAATSRRPAGARVVARWRQAWVSMVERPQFALEAAYGLTLMLVLVTSNPIAAIERTAARVEPVARQRLADGVDHASRALVAGLDALKERAAAETLAPAADWGLAARARDLWDQVVAALSGGLSDLVVTIKSAAALLWQWSRDLFGAASPTAEPTTAPVRSPR